MCIEYVEHYVKQTRTLDIQPYRAKSNSTLDLKWVQWVAQEYSQSSAELNSRGGLTNSAPTQKEQATSIHSSHNDINRAPASVWIAEEKKGNNNES